MNECVWSNGGMTQREESELVGQKLFTARVVGK